MPRSCLLGVTVRASSRNSASLTLERESINACRGCAGCSLLVSSSQVTVNDMNSLIDADTELELSMPGAVIVKLAVIAYGLPMFGILLGGLMGWYLSAGSDVGSVLGSSVGLAGVILFKPATRGRIERKLVSQLVARKQ